MSICKLSLSGVKLSLCGQVKSSVRRVEWVGDGVLDPLRYCTDPGDGDLDPAKHISHHINKAIITRKTQENPTLYRDAGFTEVYIILLFWLKNIVGTCQSRLCMQI